MLIIILYYFHYKDKKSGKTHFHLNNPSLRVTEGNEAIRSFTLHCESDERGRGNPILQQIASLH